MNMKKVISIMQPTYMPWMGYFSMIDQVDEFVFLDSVQLVNRSWQVRNKIKYNDEEKMLTIPIKKEQSRNNRLIYNTAYSGIEWKERHLGIIKQAYIKAQFFSEVMPFIVALYNREYESVGHFNENVIMALSRRIGIDTPFYFAREMDIVGHKDELLVKICKEREADTYLSALGSATYIEAMSPAGEFGKNGMELLYLNYEHPIYCQLGREFIPYIGIFDLLFNEGFDVALDIIRSGIRKNYSSLEIRRMAD